MYELSDYEGKSERVRIAMLMDDTEEDARETAQFTVDQFADDAHYVNQTRINLTGIDDELWERGIEPSDSIRGEIRAVYNRHLRRALSDAGYKDIREVKHDGKHWFQFYKY